MYIYIKVNVSMENKLGWGLKTGFISNWNIFIEIELIAFLSSSHHHYDDNKCTM